ncbi:MAG: hypothetical protein MJ154_00225 [Candidatus Saccharibacteria bacterium]|nr:hypothetical protein [Candidatus Saccharibacteria bacterium]
MPEVVNNIGMVVFFVSIFGMFIFTNIKPSKSVARWFYLLFGVSIIALMPMILEDIEEKWLIIWPILFAVVGILMFISLTAALKDEKKKKE